MNTTSQESGKTGNTGSTSGTAASMSPQTGQGGSAASQTEFAEPKSGAFGTDASRRSGSIQSGTQRTTDSNPQNWNSRQSRAEAHAEGPIARSIEQQTAKLPSDLFLWAAAGSIGVSAVLEFTGHSDKSRFVGQWVAPFLLLGVYNKLVKTQGSDQTDQNFDRSSDRMNFAGHRG